MALVQALIVLVLDMGCPQNHVQSLLVLDCGEQPMLRQQSFIGAKKPFVVLDDLLHCRLACTHSYDHQCT